MESKHMLRSLFGKGKKRKGVGAGPAQDDSIRAAKTGDVLSIQGLALEYDDLYFFVEKIHRYSSPSDTWYELTCVDGDTHIWIDWTDGYDLFVTATDDPDPVGLASIGLTEEQLIDLDEENSIDNHIEVEGARFDYRNSSEVTFYQDNRGQGSDFYHWDFLREDGDRVLSISKWEGRPFEAVFTDVVEPESIKLYKGERTTEQKG
jgi:hypothetical protein